MKKRHIFQRLLDEKNSPKVSVIIGPRQVGKTYLLKQLHEELGGIFLDLDIFSNYESVSSYKEFLAYLKFQGYKEEQKEVFYVFLDEFQRFKDLTMVMKNVYDHHKNIKIYASGSSSLTIKNQIQESLAGRKFISHIYPLSFKEFLDFKDQDYLLEQIRSLLDIESDRYSKLVPDLFNLLEEFLIYGGYPEVVLENNPEFKIKTLQSIFDLYIRKDIRDYLRVENTDAVKSLILQLAINNGSIAKFSRYGSVAGIDFKTVKNYIEILKETYLINILKPYFKNKSNEISKSPKIYFMDTGVSNFFINNFNKLEIRKDAGFLFESFYISELIKRGEDPEHIKFYRDKNKVEVDIILDRVSELIPIELKFINKVGHSDFNYLKLFMKKYEIPKGYLVNINKIDSMEFGEDLHIEAIDCFNKHF